MFVPHWGMSARAASCDITLMICSLQTSNLVPVGPNDTLYYFVSDRAACIQSGYHGRTLPRHRNALARREGANCDEDNDNDDEEIRGLIRSYAYAVTPSAGCHLCIGNCLMTYIDDVQWLTSMTFSGLHRWRSVAHIDDVQLLTSMHDVQLFPSSTSSNLYRRRLVVWIDDV